ncbi:sulfurtransferase TusA family protein [Parasphingopyxis lamellibrachiae]|uniref:tRNA 2-thiouridine synthesizing protein A n=1 Tax=Parasphingopyxis lamellibrachiae TaxID=680125 RepID=A0A3D9FFX3_9SPHN|nr:sulfurtransferase TusA family protein [Parasphingopyxis lamellibrachiae]RED16437.1 tRNA 2-thiouridine synthesizing protein A [Parasphingopyxis lamellibrachiae]
MTNNAAAGDATVDIDARGLKCPWPALRLARAMRTQKSAAIVADDPIAPAEISSLAAEKGWTVEEIRTPLGTGWRIFR